MGNEDLTRECALVEAILHLEADPIDSAAISRISGLGKDLVEKALEALAERRSEPASGLELSRLAGGWMLSPKKELWETLRGHYGKKNENRLSRAALETLSIIAYSQPVTRAEIEAIRGVNADSMIRLLVERQLVRESGKKDAVPGKPMTYGTTKEFLKLFRLESIADLPRLSEREADRFELVSEK
jgi:segregation and condensation protein B